MSRLFFVFIFITWGTQAWAADCGRFSVVKGDVSFKEKDQADFTKARINKKICQGDTVKTGTDSRTKIVMADKNEINLSPESEMTIEVYTNQAATGEQKVLLNVIYGKIRSNVKQKYKDNKQSHYRVKTKSAVAGVRGTEFLTSYNRSTGQSQIVTFKGEVAVGELKGGQFVAQHVVRPGYQSSTSRGRIQAPQALSNRELARANQETDLPDTSRDVSTDNLLNDDGADSGSNGDDNSSAPETENNGTTQPSDDPQSSGEPSAAAPTSGSQSRDVASAPSEDPMGLPPPNLTDAPKMETTVVQPPLIPSFNPVNTTLPVCNTCNDAILNKNVKVIIVPRLPGQ